MKRGRGNGAPAVADHHLAYFQSLSQCCFSPNQTILLARLSLAFGPQNCPSRPAPRTLPLISPVAISHWSWSQKSLLCGYSLDKLPCLPPNVSIPSENERWSVAQSEESPLCSPARCVSASSPHVDKTQESRSEAEASTQCIHSAARSDSLIRQA